jgi:outer membrane protein assembly factor BamB
VALGAHAAAGPYDFTPVGCAQGPGGPAGTTDPALDPGLGLLRWTGFEAVSTHEAVLPGWVAPGAPLAASWTFATRGSITASPAVVDGVAYVGSMDGCLYALDVRTGRELWSFAAPNQIMSEPLVVQGRVFFGIGNKELVRTPEGLVRGTGVSGVVALDARTGRELWMAPMGGEAMPTPAYRDGVVYEAGGDEGFYAFDAATGRLLWRLDLGSYVSMSSPTLSGPIAVVGGALPYAVYGVDVATHRIAWVVPLPAAHVGVDDVTAAVADGVAYVQVPEGGRIKRVVEMAIRVRDGRVLWRRLLGTDVWDVLQRALWKGDLAAYDGEETGIATVDRGVVYVGSPAFAALWALDARTGAPVWARPAPLPAPVRTAPVVDRGRIYVASNTALYVLDRATGRLLGTRWLGPWRMGSGILIPCTTPGPEVVGDTLLVGAGLDASSLQAIPLRDLP